MKIVSVPVDLSACGYYRVRKPLDGLKRYCGDDTYIIDTQKNDGNEIFNKVLEADIVIMRPGGEIWLRQVEELIEKHPELSGKIKAKYVMDIDDNVDYISPYSAFYKDYGLKEFKHEDMWVWRNLENGFNIENNLRRLTSLKWGLKRADMVIVTTEKLAEHAIKYNDNIYVNDNSIDMAHWWRLKPHQQDDKLTVVWQGSPSHFTDWMAIRKPLNKLMDEFDFDMIMLGSQYGAVFDKKHLNRVRALPWVDFMAHSYRMMSLQADIGIIPLANEEFNYYKSSIKWYENAAMGVPSVVSNVKPYSESIHDGVTALAYNNEHGFYHQMRSMLTSPDLRKTIADNAEAWVKENKTLEIESHKLHDAFAELIKR